MTIDVDIHYLRAWREVLQGCRLRTGELVTVLTGPTTDPRTRAAACLAARDLGGVLTVIDLPAAVTAARSLSPDPLAYVGATPLAGNAVAVAALMQSHLVIDLMLLLFSKEQADILAAGARMLLAIEPPEILMRMIPTPADRERVLQAAKLLQPAKRLEVISPAGTRLTASLGEYPVLTEYGLADAPGRWDHWPSGFVATWPDECSAEGEVVLAPGDAILPFKTYVQQSIRLRIERGYVRAIEGGVEAEFLRGYMDSFDDPEAYAVSHLGWGLQPRASWTTLGLYDRAQTIGMDARAFEGNFLFSLGPNTEAGGTRATPCHMDIPMRKCSVRLDGRPIVDEGVVVAPTLRRNAACAR